MKESLRRTNYDRIGKVLAVNSDPEIIYILEVNFAYANFELISARNGREALSKVNREKPDIIVIDMALPDIDGDELCHKLKESRDTHHIPIILISARSERNGKMAKAVHNADSYITKPFNPKDIVDLVQMYLSDKGRALNLSPLTGLPNQTQVDITISRYIEQKKIFAAIYVNMDDFRLFNKVYGYDQGDRTIRLLADIVVEAVRLFGNPDDLVGHLGGDKFVVVSTPWKARAVCRRIIADFIRRIKALYTDQRLQRGYIAYESPLDEKGQSPTMNLHVAVVTNQKRDFKHHLEVSEAAAEQMDYLKRFPGSKSYFDLQSGDYEPDIISTDRVVSNVNREEVKAMQGVLVWLDFILKELDIPVSGIKDSLASVEKYQEGNLSFEQKNSLEIIRENFTKVKRLVQELAHLTKAEWLITGSDLEEVRIGDALDWIIAQLSELSEQYGVGIRVEGVEGVGCILVDRKKLSQCLLYILGSEIHSSSHGDHVNILADDKDSEFIEIQINNPNRYVHQQTLTTLLKEQSAVDRNGIVNNQLYPAKLLIESLGGGLNVVSGKEKGIIYTIIIPKKWRGITQESNALQQAVDISRKEARTELKSIQNQISSLLENVPHTLTDSLEILQGKVQELGVLCNRSLFLADELNGRLENQQDRLLRQETEQIASLEAIADICREIASSLQLNGVFDLNSARNTAKYAMAIARALKLTESDCQLIFHATFLKDLGLVLSLTEMVDKMLVDTREKAMAVKTLFNNIWEALSIIPFLSRVLFLILYRNERYDGKGGSFGIRGDDIPLGSRILAVADTFESMTNGRFTYDKLSSEMAVQKIVDDSGKYFDPRVIRAFINKWKNREIGVHRASPS